MSVIDIDARYASPLTFHAEEAFLPPLGSFFSAVISEMHLVRKCYCQNGNNKWVLSLVKEIAFVLWSVKRKCNRANRPQQSFVSFEWILRRWWNRLTANMLTLNSWRRPELRHFRMRWYFENFSLFLLSHGESRYAAQLSDFLLFHSSSRSRNCCFLGIVVAASLSEIRSKRRAVVDTNSAAAAATMPIFAAPGKSWFIFVWIFQAPNFPSPSRTRRLLWRRRHDFPYCPNTHAATHCHKI
jgi:hypothetical protein